MCPVFDKQLSNSNLDRELQKHPQVCFFFFFFLKPFNLFSLIRIFPAALVLVLGGRCREGNATHLLPRRVIGGGGLANRLTRTGSTVVVTILKDGGNSCGLSTQTRSLLRNGAKVEGFGGDPTQMGRFLARDEAQEDGLERGNRGCAAQVTDEVKSQGELRGEAERAADFDVCFNSNALHLFPH